nr:PepSY domain-containing protein [Ensifer sp. PDNC004]
MTLTTNIPPASAERSLSRAFYTTAWRWHFYAGLYGAPFLIMLAVTGLMMLWSAVLVGRDGEKLYSVEPAQQIVAVSAQANAARGAVQGGTLCTIHCSPDC